jgi:hypothetical protein
MPTSAAYHIISSAYNKFDAPNSPQVYVNNILDAYLCFVCPRNHIFENPVEVQRMQITTVPVAREHYCPSVMRELDAVQEHNW